MAWLSKMQIAAPGRAKTPPATARKVVRGPNAAGEHGFGDFGSPAAVFVLGVH